jgi:SAM-dependent methyltransferase
MDKSEWAGRVGETWAEEWRRTDLSFAPVDEALVGAVVRHLDAAAAPHVLEIGCGAGTTALNVARRLPQARITGIDLSPALVATAAARAEGEPRCHFHQGDATLWSAETGFDLVMSRHGVMFFEEPAPALAHLRALAKPGAALIFSCFRTARANTWASGLAHLFPPGTPPDPHAPGPFAFADPERVSSLLATAGWRGAAAIPLDYAYVAGSGPDPEADAIDFFTRIGPVARAMRDLDAEGRRRLTDGLHRSVRDHCVEGRVAYPGAAWLWTARA